MFILQLLLPLPLPLPPKTPHPYCIFTMVKEGLQTGKVLLQFIMSGILSLYTISLQIIHITVSKTRSSICGDDTGILTGNLRRTGTVFIYVSVYVLIQKEKKNL